MGKGKPRKKRTDIMRGKGRHIPVRNVKGKPVVKMDDLG